MFLPMLSSPTQSLRPQWTAGMPRSENLIPSSGCGPAGQADNKDLYRKLLVFRGHCCPTTQRDGPCSVGWSSQDAPFLKGHPLLHLVPVPCRTSTLGGCLTPTSGGNHSPWAPHHRDTHALHDHRQSWYPPTPGGLGERWCPPPASIQAAPCRAARSKRVGETQAKQIKHGGQIDL